MKGEALLATHPIATASRIVGEYLANLVEQVRAELRVIADFVDDMTPTVRETIAQNHGVA
jgi:hypothetical protein